MRTKHLGQSLAAVTCAAVLGLGSLAGCGASAPQEQSAAESQGQDASQESQGQAAVPAENEAPASGEAQAEGGATSMEADEPLVNYLAAAEGTINCDLFSFDIPAYWAGKVAVSVDYEGVGPVATVTLPSNDQAVLATLSLMDGDEPLAAGDIGSHLVGSVKDGNGSHVEVWTYNWPWLVANDAAGSMGLSEDELASLVDLSTGGLLSLDGLASEEAETVNGAEYGFSAAELVPTVAFG